MKLDHLRDLAALLDAAEKEFLNDSQYVAWGEKIANLKP